jgi:protein-L-isoaspartate O-methyltransferase
MRIPPSAPPAFVELAVGLFEGRSHRVFLSAVVADRCLLDTLGRRRDRRVNGGANSRPVAHEPGLRTGVRCPSMNWQPHAAALAARVTHASSRWRAPVAAVPRHQFVPRWWQRTPDGWTLHSGPDDPETWLATAYKNSSVITRVGPLHADEAEPDVHPEGLPTSSATLPSLLVRMFQHARLGDHDELLDVGTGSGYGTALACRRLGDLHVTSIDVDPYLVDAARERLEHIELRPNLAALDATGELPGAYDRIVATVGVRPVPAGWLAALRPRRPTGDDDRRHLAHRYRREAAGRQRRRSSRVGPCRIHAHPARRRLPAGAAGHPRRGARAGRRGRHRRPVSGRRRRAGLGPGLDARHHGARASCTATPKTPGCARRGSRTRTAPGPAPRQRAPTRPRFTSRGTVACGTPSTRSAPTGSSTASCLCAEPAS